MRTQVLGTGIATGEHCVTNRDLEKIMDTTHDWIVERTGVEQRYYVEHGTSTSDLAVRASAAALADAGVAREEVDHVVFATMTPDYYFPGCGSLLQRKLGLRQVPALDIRQQCSGFLYGLSTADALLRSGTARTVLLVGAEVHSGFMPWKHWDLLFGRPQAAPTAEERAFNTRFRDRAVIFGDAAGALVLRLGEGESGFLGAALHSDGEGFEDLYVPTGGMAFRPYMSEEHLRETRLMPVMNGRAVFRMAVTRLPETIREVCAAHGVTPGQIDLLVPHQANLRINEAVAKALQLAPERVFHNIQRYGNTTAASIALAYHECRKSGRAKPGDLLCFAALGSGYHWGAALLRQ